MGNGFAEMNFPGAGWDSSQKSADKCDEKKEGRMNLDEITLGEAKQLATMFNGGPVSNKEEDLGIQIVILQRGWVFVGHLYRVGSECRLEDASVVRVWGTENGLGEIAKNGPTSKTKLDPTPTVYFHRLTTIATIACEAKKWKN